MYHHVEPAPLVPPARHADSYVTPRHLARHLDWLAAWGLRPVALAAAHDAWSRGARLRRAVVLTFDDACRCFPHHALPELARRGAGATVFAVSGQLGGTNAWDVAGGERPERLMDAGELGALEAHGVEVGSHGRSHVDLAELDDGALAAEASGSRRDLEAALGRPVSSFSYPYGRASAAARRAVRAAGYAAAVAIHLHPGAVAGDPWGVPRQPVRPGDGRLELWLKATGLYPAWSRLPRLGLLAALRQREAGS
jgi:peptidoglycan/xylan/chitin deacetylase (PgdA/CDA1 family)